MITAILGLGIEILLMGMIGDSAGNGVAMILIFLYTCILGISVSRSRTLHDYSLAIMLGYLLRVFLVLFDLYGKSIYNLPNSGYDSEMYYRCAVQYYETGYAGQGEMFSALMGTIFRFSGTNRLFGQFIVMTFSVFSLCMLASMLSCFPEIEYTRKNRIMTIVALLPNFAILSSIFLRESVITMLITSSLLFFVKWIKNKHIFSFLFAVIVGMTAALFHGGSAAICIGYIIVLFMYDNKNETMNLKLGNIILAGIIGFILTYLYLNYQTAFFSKIGNISSIEQIGSTNSEGGSSYAAYVGNSSSLASMAVFTIPRIVYFLFSPFPWQWRNAGDIIAFIFSSLFYLIAIRNAFRAIRRKDTVFVVVFFVLAIVTAFVFAWGVTNTGTASRHRDKMIMIYALLHVLCGGYYSTDCLGECADEE